MKKLFVLIVVACTLLFVNCVCFADKYNYEEHNALKEQVRIATESAPPIYHTILAVEKIILGVIVLVIILLVISLIFFRRHSKKIFYLGLAILILLFACNQIRWHYAPENLEIARKELRDFEERQENLPSEESEQGKLKIDDFAEVGSEKLSDEVVEYVNTHPESREKITDYALSMRMLERDVANKTSKEFHEYMKENTVMPLVATDSVIDKFTDRYFEIYKEDLVSLIYHNKYARESAKKFLDNGTITERVYNIFVNKIYETPDVETYNTMIKLATVKFREKQAEIEYKKNHTNFFSEPSDKWDIYLVIAEAVVEAVADNIFSGDDDKDLKRLTILQNYMKKIYDSLWITGLPINFDFKVPIYIGAYDIEGNYFPQSSDELYKENHVNSEERKKLYEIMNGEWTSLKTGEKVEFKALSIMLSEESTI